MGTGYFISYLWKKWPIPFSGINIKILSSSEYEKHFLYYCHHNVLMV